MLRTLVLASSAAAAFAAGHELSAFTLVRDMSTPMLEALSWGECDYVSLDFNDDRTAFQFMQHNCPGFTKDYGGDGSVDNEHTMFMIGNGESLADDATVLTIDMTPIGLPRMHGCIWFTMTHDTTLTWKVIGSQAADFVCPSTVEAWDTLIAGLEDGIQYGDYDLAPYTMSDGHDDHSSDEEPPACASACEEPPADCHDLHDMTDEDTGCLAPCLDTAEGEPFIHHLMEDLGCDEDDHDDHDHDHDDDESAALPAAGALFAAAALALHV